MKLRSMMANASLLTLLSVSGGAEEKPKLQLSASGGLASPFSPEPFQDAWKSGWGIGGGVSYRFNARIAIEGRIDHDQFSFDLAAFERLFVEEVGFGPSDFGVGVEIEGGGVSILSFSGALKFSVVGDDKRVSPYVIGGGGFGRLSTSSMTIRTTVLTPLDLLMSSAFFDFEDTIEGRSENAPLITFGGGIDVRASDRITVFVEGRYQRLFTSEQSTDHGSVRGGVRIGL